MKSSQNAIALGLGILTVASAAIAIHSLGRVSSLEGDLAQRSLEIASLHSDLRLLRAQISIQPGPAETVANEYDDSKLKDELESLRMRVDSVSSYVGNPPDAFGSTSLTDRIDRGFRDICVSTSHRICPD